MPERQQYGDSSKLKPDFHLSPNLGEYSPDPSRRFDNNTVGDESTKLFAAHRQGDPTPQTEGREHFLDNETAYRNQAVIDAVAAGHDIKTDTIAVHTERTDSGINRTLETTGEGLPDTDITMVDTTKNTLPDGAKIGADAQIGASIKSINAVRVAGESYGYTEPPVNNPVEAWVDPTALDETATSTSQPYPSILGNRGRAEADIAEGLPPRVESDRPAPSAPPFSPSSHLAETPTAHAEERPKTAERERSREEILEAAIAAARAAELAFQEVMNLKDRNEPPEDYN